MNKGISGVRAVPMGAAGVLVRWMRLRTATTGASRTTLVSLTATAIAATAAPAGVAARSTWPMSSMPTPAQAPNCRSLSPKGPAISGRSTTAAVPNRITIAAAAATSSSSARAVTRVATMAEAPLVAKAVPRSRLRAGLRPSRVPSQVVNNRVLTTLTAITASSGRPSAAMEANDAEKPSRTMPTWSRVLLNSPRCFAPVRGSTPMFPTRVPRQMPQVRMPTCGTSQ